MAGDTFIFNENASKRLKSPDIVDEYLRTNKPAIMAVLFACVALLVGLLAWGLFGTVTASVTTQGTIVNGQAYCFVSKDDAAKLHVGDAAAVGDVGLTVASIADVPLSRDKVEDIVGSPYLLEEVMEGNWAYPVILEGADLGSLAQEVPLTMKIDVERMAPVTLLFRG